MLTVTKTATAQVAGEYVETVLDHAKKTADFVITQVSPVYIRWNGGRGEIVSGRKLESLKKIHSWAVDF